MTIFPAIASHKFVVSFCVSLEMQQSGTRLPMFLTYLSVFRSVEDGDVSNKGTCIHFFVFSLMSPLGEAIGIVLTGDELFLYL